MADLFYIHPIRDDASIGSFDDQAAAESAAIDLLGRVGGFKSVAIVQLINVIEAQPIQVTVRAAADVASEIAAAKKMTVEKGAEVAPAEIASP